MEENQFRVPPEQEKTLYEIGQVLYEPIFLNRETQTITFEIDREISVFLEEFIEAYVFGEKYKNIFQDAENDDEWFQFLQENAF